MKGGAIMEVLTKTNVMTDIFKAAERLQQLRDMKAEFDSQLKQVNEKIEEVNQELVNLMIEEEIQNFVKSGKMFCLSTRVYASAKAEAKQELFSTLKEKGYGDIVIETVHPQTLSAFVKELMEEGDELPEWLKTKVNIFEKTIVSIRKSN